MKNCQHRIGELKKGLTAKRVVKKKKLPEKRVLGEESDINAVQGRKNR